MYNYKECQAFVDYFLAEHRRLRTLWKSVCSLLLEAKSPSEQPMWRQNLVRALQHFRDELAHHFNEEEQGGCLDEAVSYCPTLSATAERVKTEHPQLLDAIDQIIAQAKDSQPTIQDRVALENALDEFQMNWRTHEAGENELLRRAFGAGTNGEETRASVDASPQCKDSR